MPSTYSPLKIQLMAAGENSTTWGNVTNVNLGTAIEEMVTGTADVTFASNNVTLTLSDTNATQTARNLRLNLVGATGGSSRTLTVPAVEKPYIVNNTCADTVLIKNATGTGVNVAAGTSTWVYNDGTNVVSAVTALSGLGTMSTQNANAVAITGGTIAGITDLAVADGGTGASTAADARTNLAAAASGTNTDITTLNPTGGLLVGAPTGGAQGSGSLNATGLFINGVAVGTGSGSVSSVTGSGGTTGLTLTGGPITTSGTLTLGGTLAVANGGTGQTSYTDGQLLIGNTTGNTLAKSTLTAGSGISITNGSGSITISASGSGTVTSVGVSGGTTGFSFSGSPVTSSGTMTMSGTLAVANGGSGVTTSTGSGSNVLSAGPTLTGTVALASATFSGTMGAAAGTNTAPAYSASGDTNTGIYFSAADTLDITTGGTNRLSVASTGLTSTVVYLAPDGTNTAPSMAFSSDTNTGIYRLGADAAGVAAGGVTMAYWDSTGFNITGNGNFFLLNGDAPASAGAAGSSGQIGWDSSYIYVCTATNTWKRAALSTW